MKITARKSTAFLLILSLIGPFAFAQTVTEINYAKTAELIETIRERVEVQSSVSAEEAAELTELITLLESTEYKDLEMKARMILLFMEEKLESSFEAADIGGESEDPAMIIDEMLTMEEEKEQKESDDLARTIGLWTSAGTGVTFLALYNVFGYLSEKYYTPYLQSSTIEEAAAYQYLWETYDILSYISISTSVVSLGLTAVLIATDQPRKKEDLSELNYRYAGIGSTLEDRISYIENEITVLNEKALKQEEEMDTYISSAYAGLGLGLGSLVGMGIFLYMAQDAVELSNQTTDPVIRTEAQENYQLYQGSAAAFTGAAALSFAFSAIMGLVAPDPDKTREEAHDLNAYLDFLMQDLDR